VAKQRKKPIRRIALHQTSDLRVAGPLWQVQTAKARFSELFRRARAEGPQLITRQGKEGVVMISDLHYDQLVGRAHQPKNLVQFFRQSPLVGMELDLARQNDEGRELEL